MIAFVSSHDKNALHPHLEELKECNLVVATRGTLQYLREQGLDNLESVSDYTLFPESPDDLVKSLHPKIFGGILLDPVEHKSFMDEQNIPPIQLLILGVYGEMDVGGNALRRACQKAIHLGRNLVFVEVQGSC